MFCKYCGTQIDDDSAFCKNCGKKLESNSEEEVSTSEKQSEQPKEDNSKGSKESESENCKNEEKKDFDKKFEYIKDAKLWYNPETENSVDFENLKNEKEEKEQLKSNFCRYCGSEIRIGARFCTNCGKSQIYDADPEQKTTQATEQSSKNYNALCVIGFIIALLPLVFSGLIFSIIGLILSYIGLKEAERSGERGTGLAKAGVVISTILLIVSVIALISGIGLTAGLLTFAQNLDYYY